MPPAISELPVCAEEIEPHVVHDPQYKPHMVHLRTRLAMFIRGKRGKLPQREFALRTGLAQSTIMRIENREQNVTIDTLDQLCRTFHTDIEGLFPPLPRSRDYPAREQPRAAAVHEGKPAARPKVRRRKHHSS